MDNIELRDIKVINKTDEDIYCFCLFTDSLKDRYGGYYNTEIFDNCFKIKKDSIGNVYDKPQDWDSYMAHSEGGKMRFIIISQDSVNKYGWREVIMKNIYTKVYKLNINDLDKNKWEIIYNGK